jgi:hypothetical protein
MGSPRVQRRQRRQPGVPLANTDMAMRKRRQRALQGAIVLQNTLARQRPHQVRV